MKKASIKRNVFAIVIILLATGCGSKDREDEGRVANTSNTSRAPGDGKATGALPVRLVLGDCAANNSRFESGPRPTEEVVDVFSDDEALDFFC